MSDEPTNNAETRKRWTAKRRSALVIESLRGATTAAAAARKHAVTVAASEQWKERCLSGAAKALRSRPRDDEALKEQEITRLQRKLGELVMASDILTEAATCLLVRREPLRHGAGCSLRAERWRSR
jgi:transposase-like protein